MNEIVQYLTYHNGYATMKELKEAGYHTRNIRKLVDSGIIEKIKPGLYRLYDSSSADLFTQSFVDICKSVPKGVICLLSALDHYNLTTINPAKIHIAIPNQSKPPVIEYPPVEFYYFREPMFNLGIKEVEVENGSFRIYSMERTLCDIFRYRNKLGEDIALEALKSYISLDKADLNKLRYLAVKCRVKNAMLPYLKAMMIV